MATTYEAIATVTVGSGGAANIEFTSIPATFTDLLVKLSSRTTVTGSNSGMSINFNNSTTSLSCKILEGTGSGVNNISASANSLGEEQRDDTTANTFANTEIYIPNYTSSNNKSSSVDNVTENNATLAYVNLVANLWSNTAAITSVKLTPNSGTFKQYSTATLYGIKNS